MKTTTKPTHKIELTEAHLRLMAEYIEVTHRAICGQYKPLFDLIQEKTKCELKYEDKRVLESLLLSKLQPKLKDGSSYSGDFDALGYQTYRDILEYFASLRPKEVGRLSSVYSWPQSQIANEPKLNISTL